MSDLSVSFSSSIASELDKWQVLFSTCIEEGQKDGSIKSNESPEFVSDFILTTWEGSLLRMKSSKNSQSIKTFVLYLDKYIL